jgi:hypothetical protein
VCSSDLYYDSWHLQNNPRYTRNRYVVLSSGHIYDVGDTCLLPALARHHFILNEVAYHERYGGAEPPEGVRIPLSLSDGRNVWFAYTCCDDDGRKVMSEMDSALAKATDYGDYACNYKCSDVRAIMKESESLVAIESAAIIMPVMVCENDDLVALENIQSIRKKQSKLRDQMRVIKREISDLENIKREFKASLSHT